MELLVWGLVFIVALTVLLKAADFFTDAAEEIGLYFKIPSFIVGATMVAFGTSLPELATGVSSILSESPRIVPSMVVGSNISNILLITGLAIVMSKGFKVKFKSQAIEFLILLSMTTLFCVFVWDHVYTLIEGIISCVLLVGYVAYILIFPHEEEEEEAGGEAGKVNWKTYMTFLISGVFIWLGSDYTVKAIEKLSIGFGVPEQMISYTAVALGTSLPELVVTITAARKKMYGMIIGNVVGSNIFNILCVMGIPTIVAHLTGVTFDIPDDIYHLGIPIMMIATVALILLAVLKSTPRVFGVVFILLYLVFVLGVPFEFDLTGFLGIELNR